MLADARALVVLLDTGDEIDPKIGDRVFRTKSSEELRELNLVVQWAKAARLVRVAGARLVSVKKNAVLLDRPLPLWMALFEPYGKLGEALLPDGWGESLMRREFTHAVSALLRFLHGADAAIALAELGELAWATVTAPYQLDHASEQQLTHWRGFNDRDVRLSLGVLARLGAVQLIEDSAQLTALGRYGMGRLLGDPLPGETIHQVTITLLEVDRPSVWRRLLIPAATRLDRLHQVIQASMGWQGYHLHMFDGGRSRYGPPDRELGLTDERNVTVGDIAATSERIGYIYDFGDDWHHEILFEQAHAAEPGSRYPRCVASVPVGNGRPTHRQLIFVGE